MAWAGDFSTGVVEAISATEALGALGQTIPSDRRHPLWSRKCAH
jgi:hypothetical protein